MTRDQRAKKVMAEKAREEMVSVSLATGTEYPSWVAAIGSLGTGSKIWAAAKASLRTGQASERARRAWETRRAK